MFSSQAKLGIQFIDSNGWKAEWIFVQPGAKLWICCGVASLILKSDILKMKSLVYLSVKENHFRVFIYLFMYYYTVTKIIKGLHESTCKSWISAQHCPRKFSAVKHEYKYKLPLHTQPRFLFKNVVSSEFNRNCVKSTKIFLQESLI